MVDLAGPRLLDLLTPERCDWLAKLGLRRTYSDGDSIHARGDPDVSMGIVISGQVRMSRFRPDGSESFVTQIGPGQHFGDIVVLTNRKRTHNVTATGATAIDFYDNAAFSRLLEHADILLALYRTATTRLITAISMVDDLRTLSREAHLAKLLLKLHTPGETGEEVAVVQEDLAALLGVSPMTLAKSLALLKREGLVETGYRRILLPDPDKLRTWLNAQESE